MLRPNGPLAKFWWIWITIGIISYIIALIFYGIDLFTVICMAVSLGLMGFFIRYVRKRNIFFESLSRNSYGIYIVHYPIVVSLQYLLLKLDCLVFYKPWIVLVAGLFLSWGFISLIRLIPFVRKVI